MADHFWGEITIGGTIHQRDIPRFCKELRMDTVDMRWGIKWIGNHRYFVHENDEARSGMFDELERLCRDIGLPYIRKSSGKYEFSPEIVYWLPGMDEPCRTLTNHDHRMQVAMDEVVEVLGLLRAGETAEAIEKIEQLVVTVPELPSFCVEEER